MSSKDLDYVVDIEDVLEAELAQDEFDPYDDVARVHFMRKQRGRGRSITDHESTEREEIVCVHCDKEILKSAFPNHCA